MVIVFDRVAREKLREYKQLLLWGCLNRSCETCKYLREIGDKRYTCKREDIVKYLIPKYKKQMQKIEDRVFKLRH